MKKSILLGFSMLFTLSLVTAQTTQKEVKPEVKKVELKSPIGGKLERPSQEKFVKVNAAALKSVQLQNATREREEEIEKKETNQK